MNLINTLFVFVVFTLIVSFATGLIIGGPEKAKKIISWELKQLTKIGRWILKKIFKTLADVCNWAHKQF